MVSDDRPLDLSATELRRLYEAKAVSPREVLEAVARRIELINPVLNALPTCAIDAAALLAADAEERYVGRRARPLEGIPVVVKDLVDTEGLRTTYGSRIFATHVPRQDALVVERLRRAGAIIVGKAATHEFGWGITTDSDLFGPTRNPWALDRVPGGSSGGSAAALAAGLTPLAIGTDTGGSIRIPAAFCGVVGLKPTRGRVPMRGVFGLAPSLDHVGPMARTAADALLLLDALDGGGSTPERPIGRIGSSTLTHLRIGRCRDLEPIEPRYAIGRTIHATMERAEALGAETVEVEAPEARGAYATFATIVLAEGLRRHRALGLWPQQAGLYSDDVRERLERAERVDLDRHRAAVDLRGRLEHVADTVFAEVDVLVAPVAGVSPIQIERVAEEGLDFREAVMSFTAPHNLTGLPACSVPAGFDDLGLPVGVQLIGPAWSDRSLLRLAQQLDESAPEIRARWPGTTRIGSTAPFEVARAPQDGLRYQS